MKKLIKNIKGLAGVYEQSQERLSGAAMGDFPILNDAWLAIEDGLIVDFGRMAEWPGISDWRDLEVIDAEGGWVLPAYCDSHTHIVYAAARAGEFSDRIKGMTYEQIAARGGGILNSAAKLAETSEKALFESAWQRLEEVKATGTGAIEIKSGYGLSLEGELKMLRVIQRLKQESDVTIKATFLGAHAYPAAYKENKRGYIQLLLDEMIPEVAKQGLAEYIDVFCEQNYFSVEDTLRILEAGAKHGLTPKVHVNQFNSIGGIKASVEMNALSVDHLEVMSDADYDALSHARCIPVALPGCSLFIKIPYTPARAIIDRGLSLALASDYNPGSTPSGNMNLVMSLACIHMGMTPEEALAASTLNGAYAMDLSATHGSITPGKKANILITRPMNELAELPYYFGTNQIKSTLLL
jgi:imidazolonepropionase